MNYFKVDGEYLKQKIESGEYKRLQAQKVGAVKAHLLSTGDIVEIYFYNEIAEIEKKCIEIKSSDQVLLIKSINSKQYSTIISGIKFYKNYTASSDNKNLYTPVVDYFYIYEVDENIEFENTLNQYVKLSPGDFIVPNDASRKDFYSIFKYNFQDNYALSKD